MPYDKLMQAGWARGVAISLAVAVVLYVGRSLFIPLALSILLCFILTPLVERFERWRLGRVFSVVAAVALSSLVAAVFAWLIVAQILDFTSTLPEYKSNLIGRIRQLQQFVAPSFAETASTIAEIQKQIDSTRPPNEDSSAIIVQTPEGTAPADDPTASRANGVPPLKVDIVGASPSIVQRIGWWLGPALHPLATAGLIILLTVFILLDREDFRGRLVQLFASANLAIATQAINEATAGISRWLRTMCVINALYGGVVALGLYFIGLPNPLLWGVAGFAFRFLPYIGPWLAAIFPTLMSLAVFQTWLQPLLVIGFLAILELTVNTVLEPWLFARSVGLSSLGIILGVLFWAWLWGTAGILLAIPLTLWLVVLGWHIPQFRFFSVLLGDTAEMPSYHNLYQRLLAFNGEQADSILENQLQSKSLVATFGNVLVPLLQRTELDRLTETITDEQVEYIYDTIESTVEGTSAVDPAATESSEDEQESGAELEGNIAAGRSIVVVPISGRGDEIAAQVLAKYLAALPHTKSLAVSTALLTNEVVEKTIELDADAVVVVGLSLFASPKARLVVKRLQQALPKLPVIMAQLSADPESASRIKPIERRIPVVDRLEEAVTAVRDLQKLDATRGDSIPSAGKPPAPHNVPTAANANV